MAGFDLDTQRSFSMHGLKGECGRITFTADSATVEVPTALNTIFMGLGVMETDTTDGNHSLVCSQDRTISTAGAVTFTRHSPYIGDAPVMSYILLGW